MKVLPSKIFNSRGTTLLELIVVLAILTIVVSITISIFISVLQRQRELSIEDELFNQANYVLEYVSELVGGAVNDSSGTCLGSSYAGYNYLLTHFDSVNGFYQGIKFITKDGICQEFFLDGDGLFKEVKGSQAPQNILTDKFLINYARFIINGDTLLQGSLQGDSMQPRITFVLNLQAKNANISERIFQTTISQRNLNLP